MAVKKKETERTREVYASLSEDKYRVNMFFNRFSLEQLGPHAIAHFGLVVAHNIVAQYSVLIESGAIENSRESMLVFLDGLGPEARNPLEPWRPKDGGTVEVANMVQMARSGEIGEVRFGIFSTGIALERAKTGSGRVEISGNPLALLRCDLDLQRLLLIGLYLKD